MRHLLFAALPAILALGCEVRSTTVSSPAVVTTSAVVQDKVQAAAQPTATAPAAVPTTKVTDPIRPLSPEELADGWIALFDGQSLFGWQAHSKADWQVKDGAIAVSAGEKGLLCTTVPFDNYVLKADFKAAAGTNSGIFLRTAPVVGKD